MGIYWAEIAAENSTVDQLKFIKKIIKKDVLVLDLACGTGRHINALSREGYLVVGIDVSAGLLRIAQNSDHSKLMRGDMRFLPFRSNVFSYVLSMDTSLGYLQSEQEDVKGLKEASRVMKKDGSFLLDVFNSEYLIHKYLHPLRRMSDFLKNLLFQLILYFPNRFSIRLFSNFLTWRQYPSFLLLSKRSINKNGERLNDLWVVQDKFDKKLWIFKHSVRLYERRHLQAILRQANLTVDRVFGGYEQEMFAFDSRRLILISHPA